MQFTSLKYIFFIGVMFGIYWKLLPKDRWKIILLGNIVFYVFSGWIYLFYLGYVIFSSFFLAKVHYIKRGRDSDIVFLLEALVVLIPLLFFKYSGFLTENVNLILDALHSSTSLQTMEVLLPVGLSFYTFSVLAYLIDVNYGRIQPFDNILHYAAGVSFFPCLLSGPIERQEHLVPQILADKSFDYEKAVYGIRLMILGYIKKMVVADHLAIYADRVFRMSETIRQGHWPWHLFFIPWKSISIFQGIQI